MTQVRRLFGTLVLATLTAVCANATITPVAPSVDGDGCYLIGSAAELYGFAAITNGTMTAVDGAASPYCVKLTNDITVNSNVLDADWKLNGDASKTDGGKGYEPWTPIGSENNPFEGSIDGQGHVISGLFSANVGAPYGGFIAATGGKVFVKNLGLNDVFFKALSNEANVGGFVGGIVSGSTSLTDVFFNGRVEGENFLSWFVGILVYNGTQLNISNSYAVGAHTGNSYSFGPTYGNSYGNISGANVYYPEGFSWSFPGTAVSLNEFRDGSIATVLRNGNPESIWGQNVTENDLFPNFGGSVVDGPKPNVLTLVVNNEEFQFSYFPGRRLDLPELLGDYAVISWIDAEGSRYYSTDDWRLVDGMKLYAKAVRFKDWCYQVGSAEDLYNVAEEMYGTTPICVELTDDIVLNSNVLKENGDLTDEYADLQPWSPRSFAGTFDGKGHVISGLYIDHDESSYSTGFFMSIGNSSSSTAEIKNVGFVDAYVKGGHYVGGLIGNNSSARSVDVSNVFFRGTIRGTESVGGLIGRSYSPLHMTNSYFVGKIDAEENADALVITETSADIENSYYKSNVPSMYGNEVTSGFENGAVASLLHNGGNGGIWGQDVSAGEKYPNFSGVVNGAVAPHTLLLHSFDGDIEFEYYDGVSMELPRVAAKGYTFDGWYDNPDLKGHAIMKVPVTGMSKSELWLKQVSEDGCYVIADVKDLYGLNDFQYKEGFCARLVDDIVVNENVLDANGKLNSGAFRSWKSPVLSGVIDGCGHTIYGLFEKRDYGNVGFVGQTAENFLEIRNLGIEDSYFEGTEHVGGFVGYIYNSGEAYISNSHFKGVVKGGQSVGGFVGNFSNGRAEIQQSYFDGIVQGTDYVGGLFGYGSRSVVMNSYVLGNVSGTDYVGGLFGRKYSSKNDPGSITISNSYSAVVVKGNSNVDAIGSSANVDNVYFLNTDDITTQTDAIGLSKADFASGSVAYALHQYVENSFGHIGYMWGQNVYDGDLFPSFSGRIMADGYVVDLGLESDGCFVAYSAEGLYELNDLFYDGVDVHCMKLGADIVLNEKVLDEDGTLVDDHSSLNTWRPIDDFVGVFDGQGHTISGLYIDEENSWNVGFFSYANGISAVVKNLGIIDSYVKGYGQVGGLFGGISAMTMEISNVFVRGTFVATSECVGALAGYVGSNAFMTNVYVQGSVEGSSYVGALLGVASVDSRVLNAYYSDNLISDYGIAVSNSLFENGVVAKMLHNGENGSIWGQTVNEDAYPNFSGNVVADLNAKHVVLHYGEGDEISYEYYDGVLGLPSASRDGKIFFGWFLNGEYNGDAISSIPQNFEENGRVYAKWFEMKEPAKVDGCYQIGAADELYGFAAIVNGSFAKNRSAESSACGVLTRNIVLNQSVLSDKNTLNANNAEFMLWTPIGRYNNPFGGVFDGQGYTISGLYLNDENNGYVGLFGAVAGESVTIKNVGLVDAYMYASYCVGLIGGAFFGQLDISNVYVMGSLNGEEAVGSFAGYLSPIVKTSISNSYSLAKVSGDYVGILIGDANPDSVIVYNAYYLDDYESVYGNSASSEQFANGTVAVLLRSGNDGAIWGQDVTKGETYPRFSRGVIGGPTTKSVVLHYGDNDEVKFEYLDENRTLPIPSQSGKTFMGWFLESDFSGDAVLSVPANASTKTVIYARWLEIRTPQVVDGCYQIADASDLYSFAAIVNENLEGDAAANSPICAKLVADVVVNKNVLDANGYLNEGKFVQWTPIGTRNCDKEYGCLFKGSFDGQGHTISGLYYNKDDNSSYGFEYVGLFGDVDGDYDYASDIRNLGVVDSYMQSNGYTGGLIGYLEGKADVTNVFTIASLSGDYAGGFVGVVYYYGGMNLNNVYSLSSLTGNYVDALYAYGTYVNLNNCYYLEGTPSKYGIPATYEEFANGTVALKLHNDNPVGVDGSIWGQNLAVDAFPTFSGSIAYELVLDWDKASDTRSIPQNLPSDAIVRIADGKQFFVNGKIYESGVLTSEQIAEIGSNTLYPISGVTFETVENGVKATIDATSKAPLVIPTNIDVSEVALDRTFTRSVFSTIVLPFTIAKENVSGAEFFKFVGIQQDNDGKWGFAVMSKFSDIEANHPYVLMPSAENLTFNSAVTLNTETNHNPQQEGNWKLFGAYESKQWLDGDPEIGRAYGIAAESKGDNIKPGDFVKVAAGASVSPTRTYLLYSQSTSSRPSAEFGKAGISALPEVIDIVIVDGDEEQPTVIGKFNTRTGEVKAEDNRWFDMKGRVLNTKPTEKGTYFHNGKQVIVK
ncbi:InlB B-repeat-containing protein [Fibrobacter sp.]|uniref:InlB B-repeat-containing protein n=1 Tax=Fibrobacter sp. TaxID=35828 RepID=UPI00388FE5A3